MLNVEVTLNYVVIFLFLKLLLTTVCLSTGFFGGVFSPALFIGAAAGMTFAGLLALTGLETNYSVLALCGMASGIWI